MKATHSNKNVTKILQEEVTNESCDKQTCGFTDKKTCKHQSVLDILHTPSLYARRAWLPQNEALEIKSSRMLCNTGAYRYGKINCQKYPSAKPVDTDLQFMSVLQRFAGAAASGGSERCPVLTQDTLALFFWDNTFAPGLRVQVKQVTLEKAQFSWYELHSLQGVLLLESTLKAVLAE